MPSQSSAESLNRVNNLWFWGQRIDTQRDRGGASQVTFAVISSPDTEDIERGSAAERDSVSEDEEEWPGAEHASFYAIHSDEYLK